MFKHIRQNIKAAAIVAAACVAVPALAENNANDADGDTGDKRPSAVVSLVKKIGTRLDSMAVEGVDRNYIDLPEKPWQVIVTSHINQSDLKMKNTIDGNALFDEEWGDIYWESRIKTKVMTSVGVWVGYRGIGLGFSQKLGKDEGTLFKLGMTGSNYGANFRIKTFETNKPEIYTRYDKPEHFAGSEVFDLSSPIKARILSLDGYYMFNGKKFSYSAAYDQSVIQKRSAGSPMVGAMYYHSTVAFNSGRNAGYIMFMNDVGKIKQWQLSLGGGYAYNLVPCKGLLISAMAMPMITVYNKVDVYTYDSMLRQLMEERRKNPDLFDDVPDNDYYTEDTDGTSVDNDDDLNDIAELLFTVWEKGRSSQKSRITLTWDARLSLTYNIGNWFFNIYGQYNNFRYSHSDTHGRLNDWYMNASVGIRL